MERIKVQMDDPTFGPGVRKTATATMSNPTDKSWDYTAELYLGEGKAASSGKVVFSIPANSSKDVNFPITMPSSEGTYSSYIDIYVSGVLIAAYQGTEDVIIETTPGIEVGPITWVSE